MVGGIYEVVCSVDPSVVEHLSGRPHASRSDEVEARLGSENPGTQPLFAANWGNQWLIG